VTADSGARLDRLPISGFHRRIILLIGAGMFFDGFDIYVAATVLGTTLKSHFPPWLRTPSSRPSPLWA
jgi:putative MFS transporter